MLIAWFEFKRIILYSKWTHYFGRRTLFGNAKFGATSASVNFAIDGFVSGVSFQSLHHQFTALFFKGGREIVIVGPIEGESFVHPPHRFEAGRSIDFPLLVLLAA